MAAVEVANAEREVIDEERALGHGSDEATPDGEEGQRGCLHPCQLATTAEPLQVRIPSRLTACSRYLAAPFGAFRSSQE